MGKEVRREKRERESGKERPPKADLPPACRAYGPEGGAVLRTLRGEGERGQSLGASEFKEKLSHFGFLIWDFI
jgi:hypothetical protein